MNCPTCGGETYDNTQKVAGGWKGPLFKCKDPACAWVKWPPKGAKATTARGPKWTWPAVWRTYDRCGRLAEKYVAESAKRMKLTATMADVLAATATLFIAASRDGVQEAAPKQEPAPLDQPPPQLVAAAAEDDADLPF
jgi:hypothetical protein